MTRKPRIAVIGAGLGGCTMAALLARADCTVRVYEQAPGFSRLGAGIHLGPNLMQVMAKIDLQQKLTSIGSRPDFWYSRDGITGEVMARIPLAGYAETHYGAPYLTIHRGDFHQALCDAVPDGVIRFGARLMRTVDDGRSVRLEFADGTIEEADIVIGADGVNSVIRSALLGEELPQHSGYAAHRAVFRTPAQPALPFDMCTKWWADDRHLMVYYVSARRDEIYYVSGVPGGEDWSLERSFTPSSPDEVRSFFGDWHPTVQALIDASTEVTFWPLLERAPLPLWSRGRMVLLGDACHPMKPHMGQGAAMAIEDAGMLWRCFDELGFSDPEAVFRLYECNRTERTSRVQSTSQANTWLRTNENPDWCFGYDVFKVPLVNA
ncbi:MAG: FAD-dependent monooxygenase [Burkholderiaceae bacterium]